jgi:hypothetical protein
MRYTQFYIVDSGRNFLDLLRKTLQRTRKKERKIGMEEGRDRGTERESL